jgi:hypothetical protein
VTRSAGSPSARANCASNASGPPVRPGASAACRSPGFRVIVRSHERTLPSRASKLAPCRQARTKVS